MNVKSSAVCVGFCIKYLKSVPIESSWESSFLQQQLCTDLYIGLLPPFISVFLLRFLLLTPPWLLPCTAEVLGRVSAQRSGRSGSACLWLSSSPRCCRTAHRPPPPAGRSNTEAQQLPTDSNIWWSVGKYSSRSYNKIYVHMLSRFNRIEAILLTC